MKTFLWTSLIWIILILGAWVYMTNFQEDALYSFLNMENQTQKIATDLNKKFDALHSGQNAEFELLQEKLDDVLSSIEKDIDEDSSTASSEEESSETNTGSSSDQNKSGSRVTITTD